MLVVEPHDTSTPWDLAIVGAGAAGLATAIFVARRLPAWRVVLLDGAVRPGAKILVSGGGRCNVTNRVVQTSDYNGGSPHVIRRALAAFTVDQTLAFFREIGVALHEEPRGKMFPDSNSARTVLDALLAEVSRRGVRLLAGYRVTAVAKEAVAAQTADRAGRFRLETTHGALSADRVVLATGGLSLPKTGSDGAGYGFAQALGHSLVPPTPALDPLVLEGAFHAPLAGVSHEAALTVHVDGQRPVRRRGPLLWTHFGVSGPVALDVSRFVNRASVEGRSASVTLSCLPEANFEAAEQAFLHVAATQPRATLRSALANLPSALATQPCAPVESGGCAPQLPARLTHALLTVAGVDGHVTLAQLARDHRRRLLQTLLAWPLPVVGSRGYKYAEVTAGGVPLDEVDARLHSRCCPGLYLVGEILDVDGRIGGFNFQWAWSGAWALANGLAQEQGGS